AKSPMWIDNRCPILPRMSKRLFHASIAGVAVVACLVMGGVLRAQQSPLHLFFDSFTAEWIRGNPDQAIATRYFTGEEQQTLDRQLTPQTDAWYRARIALAKRGLADLARFN